MPKRRTIELPRPAGGWERVDIIRDSPIGLTSMVIAVLVLAVLAVVVALGMLVGPSSGD
jgi:hypothetical protein